MSIKEESFPVAQLKPEQLQEIQAFEQRLSTQLSHSISLVAYQAGPIDRRSPQ